MLTLTERAYYAPPRGSGPLVDMWTAMRRPSRLRKAGWQSATTLGDLGELTALWLEGRIRVHPTYGAPIPDPETKPLIKALVHANRSGYVTTQSSPAGDGAAYGDPTLRARAAVEGFADADTAEWMLRAARRAGLHAQANTATKRRDNTRTAVDIAVRAGVPITGFGGTASRRTIRELWGDCSDEAIEALCDAQQVCLVDMQWGRQRNLWRFLERMPQRRAA
jgi:Domain of unknown function (DUF6919)